MVSSLKRGVSLNLRPRWQNFTQTFLYCIPRVFFFFEISESLVWSAMSCSSSVNKFFCFSLTFMRLP